MLKKTIFCGMFALSLLMISACSSIETGTILNKQQLTTSGMESVGHIHAKIWGIYLLGLPLVTGSSATTGNFAVLTDTVTINDVVALLTKEAKNKLNASVTENLTTESTSAWIFPTVFFVYRSTEQSANALR